MFSYIYSIYNAVSLYVYMYCHVFSVTVDGVLDCQLDLLHVTTNYN
jgi:hypothetical protein